MVIVNLLALYGTLGADVGTLSGRVLDEAGQPLPDVQIEVVEVHRHATTDSLGSYRITNLPSGSYIVSFALIGYRPEVRRAVLADQDVELTVTLRTSIVEIPTLQVTASPVATSALTSPQPLSVLGEEELRTGQRPTLGELVAVLPGVRNFSTGNGIGKPVIRGLSNNRVLVLADGQRLESGQWGDEHGNNTEVSDAERVEVIRGPASVLYGSDALGGVINIVRRPLPDALDRGAFSRWTLTGAYATNGEAPDGLLAIEAASGGFGIRGSLAGRRSDDTETPLGSLNNSGYRSYGGALGAGVKGGWGSVAIEYNGRNERVEIHEDPAEEPDFTGFQRIANDQVRGKLSLPVSTTARLEILGGYERNFRREFEEAGVPDQDFALGFLDKTWTGRLHLHHGFGRWAGIAGVAGLRNTFDKSGPESLIPNSSYNNFGVYVFEQTETGRWNISIGGRYDYRRLSVEDDADLGVTAQKRTYNSVTGNLGLLYRIADRVALVLNAGRGYRSPSSFELFANGVHEGTIRFERGDPTLANETSLNGDLALRVQAERVSFEAGSFVNRIQNFIFPDPTGQIDPGSGFQIFQYSQGDATLAGFEATAEVHPTDVLHLRAGGDYTRGQNTSLDQPLPFIPPFRFTYGARIEAKDRGVLRAPYLDLNGESSPRQSRLDPEDFGPPGYTLFHVGAGVGFEVGRAEIDFDVSVRNLFDTEYTNFMSRYKTYAIDPGRNVIFRLTTRF